jgi:hypothetical protein
MREREHTAHFFWGSTQHIMSGSVDAADKVCDKCLVTETETDTSMYSLATKNIISWEYNKVNVWHV